MANWIEVMSGMICAIVGGSGLVYNPTIKFSIFIISYWPIGAGLLIGGVILVWHGWIQ
jgi:hypothetical protein